MSTYASTHPQKRKKSHGTTPPKPILESPPKDTSKPTAIFKPTGKGRNYTLSVALPGSILANAQTHDLKTHLAGQLARALAVFCVDEIIVFSDGTPSPPSSTPKQKHPDPTQMLIHILSYLETPQYLRKHLFPLHDDLRSAGLLAPLDIPSHLRFEEDSLYREGVTLPPTDFPDIPHSHTVLDAGLKRRVLVDTAIPPQTRVTLRLPVAKSEDLPYIRAEAVAPDTPRLEAGYYWGYQVREAASLSTVFTEAPFDGGYDLTFGTSERGVSLDALVSGQGGGGGLGGGGIPGFRHMLVVLGGLAGLEQAARADEVLVGMGVREARCLFDYWVDICPGQGSRTIRTEEALWIVLAGLRRVVVEKGIQ